jgi:precorrin-2 dehydrogenase/sirohydrochlorin ferrochelatase
MALYPIFLKLEGRKVLIVGGGKIAEEKAGAVLRCALDVTVVAPEITPRIREWAEGGRVRYTPGEYQSGMASEFFLVIACTDCQNVNRTIYEEARKTGVLCNAVDDPSYCDFYAPAVVSRGDFQIAISTGGRSPALAQRVRKTLEQDFGPEYASWTGWLGRMREGILEVLPRSERRTELLHLLAASKPAAGPQKKLTEAEG